MANKNSAYNTFKITSLICLAATLLVSCKKDGETQSSAPQELRIMTWSEYFRNELIEEFEKKHGVKVIQDYFSNNEELLAKIQASVQSGSKGYDVIMPSDYMVGTMIKLNLLKPIETAQFTFLAQFDPNFKSPAFDPEMKYSVPFAWGTTGIAVNTQLAKGFDVSKGVSWKDLFETKAFQGKVTMLNDSKENLNAALLALGHTWSTAGEKEIKEAFAYLKTTKKNLRIYTDEVRPVIEADECVLCQVYSGDAMNVASKKKGIVYLIPKEGATLWSDNFAIPANGQQTKLAHEFMNFMLSEKGAKLFTERTFYPTPNMAAKALLESTFVNNENIFPKEKSMKSLVYLSEKPELLPLIDKLWTELKTH